MRLPVKLVQLINLLAFLSVVAFNYLANALPLHGVKTGQVADDFNSKFIPADFTFSIWGIIYISLAIFIFYQIFLMFQDAPRRNIYVRRIGLWFVISCLLNIAWLWFWHLKMIGVAFVLMLALLIVLATIYRRLKICKSKTDWSIRILFFLPFSLYTAWVSVALIANLFILLINLEISFLGVGQSSWTIFWLLLLSGIGTIVLFKRKDLVFIIVYIFAYFGIVWERATVDFHGDLGIIVAAAFGIWVMVSASVYHIMRSRLKIPKKNNLI